MVSVCAGCDVMKPWAGLATGVIGGCLYVCFSKTMAYARCNYIDRLDTLDT